MVSSMITTISRSPDAICCGARQAAVARPEKPTDTLAPGIVVDTPWKQYVVDFARDNLHHSAWGFAHAERDYLLARELATKENLPVDDDVLFAASFLHDMGGFPGYSAPGVDHAVRSAQIVGDTVLQPAGFPARKIEAVANAILHHSYYDHALPATNEGKVLHDADTLDFLGAISVARIVSLTEREAFAPDLSGAVHLLQSLLHDAPPSLILPTSKAMGETRAAEMKTWLDGLNDESVEGKAL